MPDVNYSPNVSGAANTAGTQNYQNVLNNQINQLQQPVDANSAVVRSQTDPFHVASERGLGENRDALAEAAYAGGNLNSGDYGQEQQRARENASLGEAQHTGQVMATAEQQRESQLANDLNTGQQGSLEQQQITNQHNQFGDTLGLNYAQLAQGENQFGAQQAQAEKQFGVTSGLQQQSINNALALGQGQIGLGYSGLANQKDIAGMNTDLGYYNTNQNTGLQNKALNNQLLLAQQH